MSELAQSSLGDPQINAEWLAELFSRKCGISQPREFQIKHGLDIIEGRDVFLVIAPGQGKTTVFWASLLAAQALGKQGIALCIVPTKLLSIQQSESARRVGLRAITLNEDTVHDAYYDKRDLFDELQNGEDIRIAFLSPQMLAGEHMKKLLQMSSFKDLIRWFMIDETHLPDDENPLWRESYSVLKTMRANSVEKGLASGKGLESGEWYGPL
ncbi:uncharacterized protein LAESUDRAFT_760650 [Laetiporus sulphureus 93-53]|uniref:DNA 3'-5' helicase n=1 Tax=Laetiporus sulphureus 93-53 TaxID=1314785 RepID=A0A165DHL7_9APHY|nr:uncharacterized protein LAESUDRAFT_760650 [Laetiporus sulphureus 93-53]KZT04898.1 hypothetical protein LAESUDRAFT_760650 [Laetiporus sulphureus 93-53]